MAKSLCLGYLMTCLIARAIIAAITVAKLLGIAFSIAYILTRPLGAFFSQSPANGELVLGESITSAIFFVAIICRRGGAGVCSRFRLLMA